MKAEVFIKNLSLSIVFYTALFLSFSLFLYFSNRLDLFSEQSFLNWDAQHYFFIKENGYKDFRVAFFPLFPFAWKLLSIGPAAMAFLNGLIYICSFSVLTAALNLTDKRYFFLSLSWPSLLFMFLPYSEAIFFSAATLLLIGLHKKNDWVVIAGLLLCSLARPVAYIFIPAIFITEFLTNSNNKLFFRKGLLYSSAVAGGLFLTMAVHYYFTEEWFLFFDAQKKWGNYFRLPDMPLNTWGGGNIVRMDGTALLAGLLSSGAIILWLKKFLKHKIRIESKALVFSALYLAGISLFVLFFRGGWLFSLNRFVFATPFLVVCFFYWVEYIRPDIKKAGWCLLGLSAYWLLFGSYVHIQTILKYEALSIYLLLFMLIAHKNKIVSTFSFIVCLAGNIFMLLYFYYLFLNGGWIG